MYPNAVVKPKQSVTVISIITVKLLWNNPYCYKRFIKDMLFMS